MLMRGLLALAALSAVLPSGTAAAKPASGSGGGQRRIEFAMPASNGYRISVSATKPERKAPTVYVTARKERRYMVQYTVRGTTTPAGAVRAKLPGVGWIAVRFEAHKVSHRPVPDNCKGKPSVVTHGFFRGTIHLRGERGYTSVDRKSAPGEITESFRMVCDEHESEGGKTGRQPRIRQAALLAGSRREGRLIELSVSRVDIGSGIGPFTSYLASATVHRDGLFIWTVALAEDDSTGFLTPDPTGVLEDATVEPPAPFTGSAAFHLDSPHSSSWTGTLAVELPGIGPVSLAGPTFWSAFCEERICTKTLPPNVTVIS